MKNWTNKELDLLKIMVTDGETYATMADEFGTTIYVITNTMRKHHIPTYAKNAKYKQYQI